MVSLKEEKAERHTITVCRSAFCYILGFHSALIQAVFICFGFRL